MEKELAGQIIVDIVLNDKPWEAIREWRLRLGIPVTTLAKAMDVRPSVVSDLESGRRKSPGASVIKRIALALCQLKETSMEGTVKPEFSDDIVPAIIDKKEFRSNVIGFDIQRRLKGELLGDPQYAEKRVHGYTLLDSVKAIMSLRSTDFLKVYGFNNQRALIFTDVEFGRSPMIAIRTHPIKPAMVVFHNPKRVDDLSIRLADDEGIGLISCTMGLDEIRYKLNEIQ